MSTSTIGSIVRITLKDFMQYSDVTFHPGSNLNVIIGPNGSGKSTLVNAICLGLAGKTGILGRASNVTDFIRTGCDEARTEIELFHPDGNQVISRSWSHRVKGSKWTVNGKAVPQKEVEGLVRAMKIQVGNLCQFLPQDKVQDFSKMNSKMLLNSTIDAVGEVELKESHEKLKKLQNDLGESEDRHQMKLSTLADNKTRCARLETEVKNFEEKEKIERKIQVLVKKKEWVKFYEQKRVCQTARENFSISKRRLEAEQDKLEPIKKALQKVQSKKQQYEEEVKKSLKGIKENLTVAKHKSETIESLEEEVNGFNDQLKDVDTREQERKERVKEFQNEIRRLQNEVDSGRDETNLDPQINAIKRDISNQQEEKNSYGQLLSQLKMEKIALENRIRALNEEKERIQNLDNMKLETLKQMPNGHDVVQAVKWLRANRDSLGLQGQVFEPLMLTIDLKDPSKAVFFENMIPFRDLVAFSCECADDMNSLLNKFRHELNLKVNAFHADPSRDPDHFQPDVDPTSFGRNDFFEGYLRDMIEAPRPILGYLCQMYQIHNVPVFGPRAANRLQHFTDNFNFRTMFVGMTRHVMSVSQYSGQKSVQTNDIAAKNILTVSADKATLQHLDMEISECELNVERKLKEMRENNKVLKETEINIEEKRKQVKDLVGRKEYVQKQKRKLNMAQKNLEDFLRVARESSSENEKNQLKKELHNHGKKTLAAVKALKKALIDGNHLNLQLRLQRLKLMPMQRIIDAKKMELTAAEDGLKDVMAKCEELKEIYEREARELKMRLSSATEATGRGEDKDKPPERYADAFAQEPDDLEAIDARVQELQDESEQLEDIDPRVVREYKKLKQSIEELEAEIARRDEDVNNRKQTIDEIKREWKTKLDDLIGRIDERFGKFFRSMGFAGEIKLHEGDHENDFHNYGIDILVKYRANVQMEKLTGYHQSGGERSVATALYMLALQELTQVPFRCVDEINQGMDAKNERRVFELLVRTSCRDNSAQYFLLTPKLLPHLNYEENMNVLIVNNGERMCHHSEWSIDEFVNVAERA